MKGYSVGRFVPTRVILPGISVCRFSSSKCSNQKADNAEVKVFAQRILTQKIQVLHAISDDDYIRKLSSSSSVGAHIRHSLDHFNCVFDACDENAVLDYDSRNRDSDNERVREAALKNCNILLEKLHQDISDIPVMVRFLSDSSAGMSFTLPSTKYREIAFVSHHAVHHLSTIRTGLHAMGYDFGNSTIGIASSTQLFEKKKTK